MKKYMLTHTEVEDGYEINMILMVNGRGSLVVDKDKAITYDGVVIKKKQMLARAKRLNQKMEEV